MARPLRVEFPGAFYHVTFRGNEGKAIFRSKLDREGKLEIMWVRGQNIEIFIKNIMFQDLPLCFQCKRQFAYYYVTG